VSDNTTKIWHQFLVMLPVSHVSSRSCEVTRSHASEQRLVEGHEELVLPTKTADKGTTEANHWMNWPR